MKFVSNLNVFRKHSCEPLRNIIPRASVHIFFFIFKKTEYNRTKHCQNEHSAVIYITGEATDGHSSEDPIISGDVRGQLMASDRETL